ncbi:MAG: DUF3662 and FHA domain-containing protein [Anaerolineae bacterium]|nr:MAG: DUF3662 and FHA domain-containing protein [Anaerolineae bacterium]
MTPKPLEKLARFEALAERWLEGGFARLFRARLHRAELAEHLSRALEDGQTAGPNGAWLAPDDYQVFLHPDDYARLGDGEGRTALEQALTRQLMAVARQAGATLTRRPQVHLSSSEHVPRRQVKIQTHLTAHLATDELPPDTQEIDTRKAQEVASETRSLACQLLLDSRSFPLTDSPVSLGRGLDNDVIVEYPRVSRHHAQLRQRQGQWWLIDLGSANGTAVNDRPVSEAALHPGDVISLAGVEIRFELQAPGPTDQA